MLQCRAVSSRIVAGLTLARVQVPACECGAEEYGCNIQASRISNIILTNIIFEVYDIVASLGTWGCDIGDCGDPCNNPSFNPDRLLLHSLTALVLLVVLGCLVVP